MKIQNLLTPILLCILSVNVMAETDFSAIEAEERAQIISELTYSLGTKQNCSATLNWDDSGSGADLDGYFFLPSVGNSEFIIGGHASGKRTSDYHCVTTVSIVSGNPEGTPPLLVAPANWQQVWKDSGSGAAKDGSFWNAIPPDDNYKCIGSVSQLFHDTKPNLANYRCVHKSLTDKVVAKSIVWSDKGTGAKQQVTIFNLTTTGTYTVVASRASTVEAYDLKKNATSVPDPKVVEEILAKRIAPLKAGIEAKTKAIQEQRQADKKEETKKDEAAKVAARKKAEQEKLAAVEAKKKQEAAQKAVVAKVEPVQEKNTEVEAQKLKEQQQARIAKAMEEKAAKEKTKQAQEEKAKQEEAKAEPAKTESKIVAEQTEQAEPEMVEAEETRSESADKPKSESKGLNDIMMFFIKVFGMMIGGVLVFMIAFKVLFGKKKEK